MKLELDPYAPFRGEFTGLGSTSADSIVGTVRRTRRGESSILKWNKRHITSPESAEQIATYMKKSVRLYKAVLGSEFIIPTTYLVGA